MRQHHEAAITLAQLLPAAVPLGIWLKIRIKEAATQKKPDRSRIRT